MTQLRPWLARPLGLLLAATLAACSNGVANPDVATAPDVTGTDVPGIDAIPGQDVQPMGTDVRMGTDGPRIRDTAVMMADSAMSRCFIMVTPRTGAATDTFVAEGTGFTGSTVTLSITMDGSTAALVSTMVNTTPASDGTATFTYNFMQAGLARGNYQVHARDPLFVCTFDAPFTVM